MIQLLLVLLVITVAGWFMFRTPENGNKKPASGITETLVRERELQRNEKTMLDASIDSAALANERILKTAVLMFYASHGRYPQTLDDLIPGCFVSSIPFVEGYDVNYNPATGVVKYQKR